MYSTEALTIIKDSFEVWYNKKYASETPVSIVINYSDVQKLALKAFHTITMEVKAFFCKDNIAHSIPIVCLQENYNHGVTSEEEAKNNLTEKLLVELYGYSKG